MRSGAILALAVALIAVAIVSGSNRLPLPGQAETGFAEARAPIDQALSRAEARLNTLRRRLESAVEADSVRSDRSRALSTLEARRTAIVQTLDSIAAEPGEAWRGAMAGIRANVADLEARIDHASIRCAGSPAARDSLYADWLDDADGRLGAVELRARNPEGVSAAHSREIDELRANLDDLAGRFAEVSGPDGDAGLRAKLGDELVPLRRRLRALERKTGSHRPEHRPEDAGG